jgi:hypothetical protein
MKPIAVGECDACPKVDVDLFEIPGSKMRLCVVCHQAEIAAIESSKVINGAIATAKVVDSGIKLKADIFNAATVDFTNLQAAIMNDESISPEKKAETLVQMASERIQKYNQVIFQEEEATMIKRNERASWSKQIKEFVETLRTEQREKFKKYDINYSPAPISKAAKTSKPAGPRKKAPAFDMAACKAAAAKYNVPMASIQMLAKSQNLSMDDAGKKMAEMLGITVTQ